VKVRRRKLRLFIYKEKGDLPFNILVAVVVALLPLRRGGIQALALQVLSNP
jgi:hypothetical protein